MRHTRLVLMIAALAMVVVGCKKEKEIVNVNVPVNIWQGKMTHDEIIKINGFEENRASILAAQNVSMEDFIRISTDSAWALPKADKDNLKAVRTAITHPDSTVLLQKIIPLTDLVTYMENIYGGTVGGYIAVAADVKNVYTMNNVYYGMRLDYPGTKFKPNGAGYAVIRFYSNHTDKLGIPFCHEMGGDSTFVHSWPNTGGGFTASTLGSGGYPEYNFRGYFAPKEGAELYEITPEGNEILRSTYTNGAWSTFEGVDVKSVGKIYEGVNANYMGFEFMLRGIHDGKALLTTYNKLPIEGLEQIERGLYGVYVEESAITIE